MIKRENIRNIAIIAHVDHGKTTLVDAMLAQSVHSVKTNKWMKELWTQTTLKEKEVSQSLQRILLFTTRVLK